MVCAGSILGMFYLDRDERIEHSVPYTVAFSWILNASILGAKTCFESVLPIRLAD
jgi:hypothetical protein